MFNAKSVSLHTYLDVSHLNYSNSLNSNISFGCVGPCCKFPSSYKESFFNFVFDFFFKFSDQFDFSSLKTWYQVHASGLIRI